LQFEQLALGGSRQRILVDGDLAAARKTTAALVDMLKVFETPVDGVLSSASPRLRPVVRMGEREVADAMPAPARAAT